MGFPTGPELPPRPDLVGFSSLPKAAGLKGMFGRAPARWSAWEAVGMFLLGNLVIGQVLVAGVILVAMGVDQVSSAAGTPELAATLGADVATVTTIVIWLSKRYPGWVDVLGLPAKGERIKELVYGIVAGPVVYIGVAFVVAGILSIVLGLVSGRHATSPAQIDAQDLSVVGQILTVIVAVLVAPVTEELMFRGVLFRAIRDRRGFWWGASLSAVLFGLVHFVPAPWQDSVLLQASMVFTGLALAWIYERRGNLLACIFTHMTFNAIGVVLILTLR